MSLRTKSTRGQKTKMFSDDLIKKTVTDDDKENQSSNQGVKRKNISGKSAEAHDAAATEKPETKFSCMGFWSKKLQDLEISKKKTRKSELYEFSCTEESDASYKAKKKPKQKKQQLQKKRKPAEVKYKKPVKSTNKILQQEENILKQALFRKEKLIKKERKKVTDEHKNCTLPPALQSVAFTSTPAVHKSNLIDPPNFLFLSPISKEETKYSNGGDNNLSVKLNSGGGVQNVTHCEQETPKVQTKLRRISCRRVLRSGKMLST